MAARDSFKKAVAGIIGFAAIFAGASDDVSAQTWVGNNGTTTASRENWYNTNNWTGGVPGNNAAVTLPGTASRYALNISGTNTSPISTLTTAAGLSPYTLKANTGAAYVFADGAQIINNRVDNNGDAGLNFTGGIEVQGTNGLTLSGTGVTQAADIQGSGLITVNGGKFIPITSTMDMRANSGGTIVTSGADLQNVTIASGGTLDGGASLSDNTVGDLTLLAGSTTLASVAITGTSTSADNWDGTSITLGGTLNVDWSSIGSTTMNNYTAFNIFNGTLSGNFTAVNLLSGTSPSSFLPAPYQNLAFTQDGSEWKTQTFVGQNGQNQWLVFSSETGNLVVVPEPSTIVFAGVGVAMAGWSAWKKRRMTKVLAKS